MIAIGLAKPGCPERDSAPFGSAARKGNRSSARPTVRPVCRHGHEPVFVQYLKNFRFEYLIHDPSHVLLPALTLAEVSAVAVEADQGHEERMSHSGLAIEVHPCSFATHPSAMELYRSSCIG